MRRTLRATVALTPLLLLSSAAFAAGGACGEGLDAECTKWIGIHAANFVILFVGLGVLVRKPLAAALKNRAAEIKQDLDDSTAAKSGAQERLDALTQQVDAFAAEAAQLKAEAAAQADRDAEFLREKTQAEVARLAEQNERAIREEVGYERRRLQVEAVDRAIAMAEERLRGAMTGADHHRLNQEFLGGLGTQEVADA